MCLFRAGFYCKSQRKSVLNTHGKDWCWRWSSNTLATWCEELTHWKRPCFWERLKAGGEGDDRGWDGWMASLTWWTWVSASSRSWWWTGRPGGLQSMGSDRGKTSSSPPWRMPLTQESHVVCEALSSGKSTQPRSSKGINTLPRRPRVTRVIFPSSLT